VDVLSCFYSKCFLILDRRLGYSMSRINTSSKKRIKGNSAWFIFLSHSIPETNVRSKREKMWIKKEFRSLNIYSRQLRSCRVVICIYRSHYIFCYMDRGGEVSRSNMQVWGNETIPIFSSF
jgi:hypothetical protein